ncbi:hypothetical protein [Fibrobacter sp.]|uniref:hypothetical protein n=1 Tax=Fibrobacter sp. TaxID=35828 RepID=UPI003890DDBE
MKTSIYTITTAIEKQRNELVRFFRAGQYVALSHWAKITWCRILRISLFGEISESVAVEIMGQEMIGPCTMAIVHDNVHTWLIVADKIGVAKIDLQALTHIQLERLAGMLNGRIWPADVLPNDYTKARQECLEGEISAMDDGSPTYYLAGV